MKHFKNLKKFDIFGTQVQTFITSRDKKLNKKTFETSHGSIYGGIISILFIVISGWYLYTLFQNMINGNKDNIS